MKIFFSEYFKRKYKKLTLQKKEDFKKAYKKFEENQFARSLHTHKFKSREGLWSFRINYV